MARIPNLVKDAVHEKATDVFRATLGEIHNLKFYSWVYSCTHIMSPELSSYRRLSDIPFNPWKDVRYLFFDDDAMQCVEENELAGYPGFFYSDHPLKDLYRDFLGNEYIEQLTEKGLTPEDVYIGVIDLKEGVYLRVNGEGHSYPYQPDNLREGDPEWNKRWFFLVT